MHYERFPLREELVIRNLITFHYKELTRQFNSRGENHDFWELAYVDKGEVEIFTDTNSYELSQGDVVFYKPNEFHSGRARNNTAPNLINISFECSSACMEYFQEKSLRLGEEELAILSKLVAEGTLAFDPPVDSPNMVFPKKRQEAPFGSEQIIKNYLEILLITLIRKGAPKQAPVKLATLTGENRDADLIAKIIEFLKANASQSLTPELICSEFAISRTRLMTMFKLKTGTGIIEYFNKIKIDKAKALIREEQYNFTEISEQLGYSSTHYFSRHFKKETNMTPTEYARSVKARSGRRS